MDKIDKAISEDDIMQLRETLNEITMETLTIEKLAPYLPYKLQMYGASTVSTLIGLDNREGKQLTLEFVLGIDYCDPIEFSPILRPLSDLTKEIEINGEKFVPKDKFDHEMSFYSDSVVLEMRDYKRINLLDHPLKILNKLFEWHFDVFGLIPEGLAIDINTL